MDNFDIAGGGTWEEKEGAGQPADPAGRAPGAHPSGRLAPGGGAWAPSRRGLPRPRPAPSAAQTHSADRPCTSIEDIYTRHQRMVWSKLRRSDIEPAVAKEIHQEVFLAVDRLIHMDRLHNNVEATLTTITGHLICNHLRRRKRHPELADEVDLDEVPASQLDVEQRVGRAERKRLVEILLAKLPRDAARLIQWIDLGELTQAEVARILERPLKTVKTQHLRARARFRDLAKRLYAVDLGGGA